MLPQNNLQSTKLKVASMIIDRLMFVHDLHTIVCLADALYSDRVPEDACGMRDEFIQLLRSRHRALLEHDEAWKVFSDNKNLLKALHRDFCY